MSRGTAPLILKLSNSWMSVGNFIPCPLHPPGKDPGNHSIGQQVDPRASVDIYYYYLLITRWQGSLHVTLAQTMKILL